jgi:hypothetical protein
MEAISLAATTFLSGEELLLRETVRRFLKDTVVPLSSQRWKRKGGRPKAC